MDYYDQLQHKVVLKQIPKRIISLVPSQTELLFDLGLEDEVVGITKFCIHPKEWHQTKKRVGGTKSVHYDVIEKLQPDLIIANKEENTKEMIEHLQSLYPVWTSDITTLEEAFEMILSIGEITDQKEASHKLVSNIQEGFDKLEAYVSHLPTLKTAYLIWQNPYMLAGRNTFIGQLMEKCKLTSGTYPFETSRYPQVDLDQLKVFDPELILLSSEPYPFKEKHLREFKENFPDAKTYLVDGELCSWYGSRLVKSPKYLKELLKKVHSAH